MKSSNMALRVSILSPERQLYSGDADQVTLPAMSGEITVLPGHIGLVTLLHSGEVLVASHGEKTPMVVYGGFARIERDSVTVLADFAQRVDEILIEQAQEAHRRAQEELESITPSSVEYAALSAQLEKELARLKVVRKYRNRE